MPGRGSQPDDATATTVQGDASATPPSLAQRAATPPGGDAIADRQLKNTVKGQLFGSEQPPVKIDRFTVIKQLGAGGMGVVYSAYDDELERKVAIKLLHAGSSRPGSEGRARLLREAQAMAKLSHPNVVSVYEVGTHDGAVFVAMEYVKGETLRKWLTTPRTRAEILGMVTQAGRGLAAAHAAGIVHRDFKPENVMVQAGGRVRVLDFGLARPHRAEPEPPPADDGSFVGRRGLLDSPLTQEGAIVGTPSYMAPEQHAGGGTDARSDQFAFCVVLYEALYGQRPYQGDGFKALSLAVLRGKLAPEPTDASVPGWIRDILLRGLSVEPEDRYETMDDLLAALNDDPTIKLRRWAAAAAISLAIIGAGAGGIVLGSGATEQQAALECAPAPDKLAGAWDTERKRQLERSFADSGAAGVDSVVAGLSSRFDEYADEWANAYAAACELAADADADTIALAEKRHGCLDGRIRELGALTTALSSIDAERAPYAGKIHLARIDRCEGEGSVDAQVRPPTDGSKLAEVTQVRLDIAHAVGLAMGDKRGAPDVAARAVERARATGFPPVEAQALLAAVHAGWASGTAPQSIATAEEAALVAESSGDMFTFIEAAFETAKLQLVGQGKLDEAERWIRRAEAVMERIGNDRLLEGKRAAARGTAMLVKHESKEAAALLERAVQIEASELGEEALALVPTLNNLAVAQQESGQLEDARRNLERHARIIEKHLGRNNQHLAYSLMNTAAILVQQDKPEDALAYTERGLKLIENSTPEGHPRRALALQLVAENLERLGRTEDAFSALERAELIVDGAEFDAQAVSSLTSLASLQRDRGRHRAALKTSEKYISKLEHQFSGEALAKDEKYGYALAMAAVDAALVGKHGKAVSMAERSLAMATKKGAEADKMVLPRYALARALAESGRSSERARRLAETALRDCPALEKYMGRKLQSPVQRRFFAEMKAWLETQATQAG